MKLIILLILSVAIIVIGSTRFKIHPFLTLLGVGFFYGIFSGMPLDQVIASINGGFGSTIGSIGIIIIFGIIIGTFLEKSGGAYVMANSILKWIGVKQLHGAMALIGYVVSIPVFADSGFVILEPLNRALSLRAKVSLTGTALALAFGLMCTHTLVPPTPGPIAAAGILGADLGLVILLGLVVSFGAMIITTLFSKYVAGRTFIDPADKSINATQNNEKSVSDEAPSAFKSFLPIVIPILLIVLRSISEYPTHPLGEGWIHEILSFIGNPMVALSVGILLAMTLPRKLDLNMLSTSGWVGTALRNAAIIILVTGAGGAFGKVLQNSGIADVLGGMAQSSGLGLWLPFLIAGALKSAQGSSTVAIITTSSLILPLMGVLGIETAIDKAMIVVAIGAGSAVVSHINDSFFWVVTQLTGMNVTQGFTLYTLGSGILGLTAMILLTIINVFVQ